MAKNIREWKGVIGCAGPKESLKSSLARPLPLELIAKVVKFRIVENRNRAKLEKQNTLVSGVASRCVSYVMIQSDLKLPHG